MIPYGRHWIDHKDVRAVVAVLRSDRITQGPNVPRFEERFARYCGARYAVAVSSGTAALHLASLVLDLKKGDEVITSPISFVATSNAVLYVSAKPVFADIEYQTANLSIEGISSKINGHTKAIYPVHFSGLPCDMVSIDRLAEKPGLRIVEDASHALGSQYRFGSHWYKVGSCAHSDMAIFSFHPVKHITSGEGGMITTNSRTLHEKLRSLRSHGIERFASLSKQKGAWHYRMNALGFNYRMSDIQAALGLSQLAKIDWFVKRRRRIANAYCRRFQDIGVLEVPKEKEGFYHSYHLYVLKIRFDRCGIRRALFIDLLRRNGIETQVHYIPIYRQPFYRKLGYRNYCKQAERYYRVALSLPIYPAMTQADVDKVAAAVTRLCRITQK